jgi:glucuronide carrier protein
MIAQTSTAVPSSASISIGGVQRLSWSNIVGYGFGDIANNFAFAMGALFLLNYYTDVAAIPAAAAGTMLLVVRVFDACADIFAGRVVDATSTKWGKFRPFLLFGAVPLMLFSILVFSVPHGWDAGAKLIYAYATYAGLGLCYSMVNIPYGSLATVMTQVPQERARLASSRTIQAQLTFAFLAVVIGGVIRGTKDPVALQELFTTYTTGLAVAGVILYVLCFRFTREVVPRSVARAHMGESLATLRQNTPLMLLCLACLFLLAGFFSMIASTLYFARVIVGDVSTFITISLINTLGGALVAAPTVPFFVHHIGKKKTFMLGCLIAIVGYVCVHLTPPANLSMVYAAFAIVAFGGTLALTVVWALEADTVEYGEWKTGIRIEGLTYSLFSFTRKCGQAIGGSIPAFLLAAAAYDPKAPPTDAVKAAILNAFTFAPAICFAAALAVMVIYPLTDARFKEIVADVARRRAKG